MINLSTVKSKCGTPMMKDANTNAALLTIFKRRYKDPNCSTVGNWWSKFNHSNNDIQLLKRMKFQCSTYIMMPIIDCLVKKKKLTLKTICKDARSKRPHFMLLLVWNVQNKQIQRQKINSSCQGMGGGELRGIGFLLGVMEIFWN